MAGDRLRDLLDPGAAEFERAVVERQLHEYVASAGRKQFVQSVVQRPRAVQRPGADLDPQGLVPENVVGMVLPELKGNAPHASSEPISSSARCSSSSVSVLRVRNALILVGSRSGLAASIGATISSSASRNQPGISWRSSG